MDVEVNFSVQKSVQCEVFKSFGTRKCFRFLYYPETYAWFDFIVTDNVDSHPHS